MFITILDYYATGEGRLIQIKTGLTEEESKEGMDDYFLLASETFEIKKMIEGYKDKDHKDYEEIKYYYEFLEEVVPYSLSMMKKHGYTELNYKNYINVS